MGSGAVTAASLSGITTDNVSEGSSNTYFTNARARGAVSVTGGNLSYDSSTGVIQLTTDTIRSRFSAGTGVSISSGAISIGQSVATTATPTFGNITTTGYIAGPSTFTIDPAAVGDNTGTVVIAGDLQVDGTTTTINSTTLTVDDKLVTLASGSANAGAANGAGIEVDISGATNPSLLYDGTNDEWDFNKDINVTGTVTTPTLITGAYGASGSAGDGFRLNSTDLYGQVDASDKVRIAVAGNSFFNGGNVGIGTNNPNQLLHLSANGPVLALGSSGTSDPRIDFYDQGTTNIGAGIFFDQDADSLKILRTITGTATDGIAINANGRVAIGIVSADAPLHVEDNTSSAYGGLRVVGAGTGSGSTNVRQIADFGRTNSGSVSGVWLGGRTDETTAVIGAKTASGNIAFEVYNSGWQERMRIKNDGKVGIGTANPTNTLDLGVATMGRGITWTNYSNLFSEYSNASTWLSSNFYGNAGASGHKVGSTGNFGAAAIRVHATGGGSNSGIIQFFTDTNASKTAGDAFTPTERMKIDNLGKVYIGTITSTDDCLDIGNTSRDTAVNMSKASGGAVTREIIRFNGPLNLGIATGGHHTKIYGGGASAYLEIEDSGRVLAKNTSTAASPVYTFQNDENTGLYSPAADTIELSTAGVRGLSVQSDSSVLIGATMASVNATQKSGKIAGKATPNVMEWPLPRSNTSYQHGDSVAGFSSAYGLSYGLNGDSAANKWKLGEGPSGCTEWLWAGISAGSTGGSGGWGTGNISIDNNYSYLFVLWVKRVSSANTGTYYHGTGGVHDTSGNALGNPYMAIASTGTLPQNVWCVDIQPIHAWHMTSNVAMGNQGLWRTDTGARLQHHSGQFSGVNIYRAGTSSNQSHIILHRTYLYYPSANDGTELHWACPKLYRIDGSQPSAAAIISGEMNAAVAGMS